MDAFRPTTATVSISGTTSSAAAALNGSGRSVRIYNAGAVAAFFAFRTGGPTAVATLTSMPIAPGAVEIVSVPEGTASVAVITASSTATVYFTRGEGL